MKRVLFWFRNDLRLEHHPALQRALGAATSIAFVYVHDPRQLKKTNAGIARLGWHRRRFLRESLDDLSASLNALGHSLIELNGYPEKVISDLIKENQIDLLCFSKECAPEEQAIENQLFLSAHTNGFQIQSAWSQFLIEPDALPFALAALPQVFTEYRKKIETHGLENCLPKQSPEQEQHNWPAPLHINAINQLKAVCEASLGSIQWDMWRPDESETQLLSRVRKSDAPQGKSKVIVGGSTAAHKRVEDYFFKTHAVANYYSTRNGLLNPSDSTLFSPWLAHGCLSAGQIFNQLKHYEQRYEANKSTYWVVFELLWRDYFKLHLLREGARFFDPRGSFKATQQRPSSLSDSEIQSRIDKVLSCQTQDDFINANMRELIQTGFMSNRGRQNVASYMIYDLQIPWFLGAWIFESLLIDYDVASNWGNWAYIAGVRFDPRGGRKFDVPKQRRDYDPDGLYVAAWSIP